MGTSRGAPPSEAGGRSAADRRRHAQGQEDDRQGAEGQSAQAAPGSRTRSQAPLGLVEPHRGERAVTVWAGPRGHRARPPESVQFVEASLPALAEDLKLVAAL